MAKKKRGKVFWVVIILVVVGSVLGIATGRTGCSPASDEDLSLSPAAMQVLPI